MTREEREIIKAIKSMGYDRTAYPREKVSAVISMAIEALQHDVIFEQIKWERDVALQTLEDHGIGLGQKCGTGMEKGDK